MMNLILNEKDKLIEQGINKEVIKANETLFALANGHLEVILKSQISIKSI